jgi:hypothetical protein
MVKLAIQVVRDAHYEAQIRTVDVSHKPAIGKSLFSEQLAQSSGGSFQASFETERFVHGKLREFTLRSASHWQDVRAVLPDKTAQVNGSTFNVEHINEIEDSLMYRIIAESMNHSVGIAVLASVPRALRAYVLAQMIRDSDMSVMNAESVENRAELQARLTLRRVLKRVGFNSKDGQALRMNIAGVLVAASVSINQSSQSAQSAPIQHLKLSSTDARKALAGVMYSLTASSAFSTCCAGQSFASKCMDRGISIDSDSKMNAESSKLQTTQRDLSSSTVERYGVAKGIEEGFGTAPIWFQQSMADGPPGHISRWERQGRAATPIGYNYSAQGL